MKGIRSIRPEIKSIKKTAEIVVHNMDERKRTLSSEFKDLERALTAQLATVEPPKILQVTLGKDEYVSIRRLEGAQILEEVIDDEDALSDLQLRLKVPARFMEEEDIIGVLVSRQVYKAEPKDEDDIRFIYEETEYDNEDGWSHIAKLQYFLRAGGEFKRESWDFTTSPIQLGFVKRIGGELYTQSQTNFTGKKWSSEQRAIVKKITPDDEGLLTLGGHREFWSKSELEVQKMINEQYTRFYVLVKGTPEKRDRKQPDLVGEPQVVPIRVDS